MVLLPLLSAFLAAGLANAQCNPMQTKCPVIPGLATKEYSIDFTKETQQPSNWTLADQATVKYGANGADFTFAKRFDAPYIWTSFYFLFGKVEIVAKASKGTGIVTGAVLMSDCLDEIDWEWSGSNFGSTTGKVQTNVFGKGITGVYNRGTQPAVSNPSDEFHTYVLDWTPDSLIWSIDGKQVRKEDNNKQLTGNYQYPQTPSRLHLGIWNGGDANSSDGVVQWVGGHTDLEKVPYTAYVKSVKITNQNPCSSWQYPENFKGAWTECKCTNETIASPTTSASASATPKPTNLPCTYTVSTGDYGYGIADKLQVSFADLNSANNGIDWDKLLLGQQLKVPGGNCSTTVAASNTTMTPTAKPPATTDITTEIVMTSLTTCPVTVTHTSGSSTFTSVTKTVSTVVITSTSTVCTRCTAVPYSNATTSAAPTGTGQSCVYYVADGDNGYGIAQKVKVSFSDLNAANPVDWDKLLVGQGLKIPGSKCFPMGNNITSTATAPGMTSGSSLPPYANTTTFSSATAASNTTAPKPTSNAAKYVVCEGDTGYKISEKLGCDFSDLNKANPDCDWDKLLVGQQLNACKNTPANNTNVITPGQSTNVPAQSTKPTTATQNGTALSTITVKPSGSKASDIHEICVIKSTTVCPSSPVANMNKTTTTAIYTNGSITVIPTTISTPKLCEYTVVNGDYGYKIAEHLGITFDELNKANPGQDWDKLLIGQMLKVPGDQCSSMTTSTQTATSTRTNTVVVGKSGTTNVPPQTPASSSSFTAPATNVNIPSQPGTTSPATSGATSSQSSSTTSTTPPPVCNHDNCYNNMVDKRYSSSVLPFCSMFVAPGNTNVPIPTYLGGCQTKSERVSSACKCIMTSTRSASSPSTSSTSTSDSSSDPLTSTGSSSSTSSGTISTTVVTTGSTDTVLTSSGTTPATLGTTATTDNSSSTTPGSTPETLGTTSSTSSISVSTTGGTSSSSTTSGSTSSTTPGTSSSSTGTLGTTSSTSSTASTSSTTPGTSTPPTTSSTSSSSSSTTPQTTPPTTSSGTTSPPTTPPTTKPTTPPTTPPTTTTQPPKTPPTTSHKTTTTEGWGDWNGGSGGNGANGWDDWSGSQGGQGMGGDSGRGNSANQNKGSGNNAAMGGQSGHHKREAAAPNGFGGGMPSSGGQGKGSNSQGSSFFGKFGWGKRSAAPAPPTGAGGSMGQGFGQGMTGGSAPGQGAPANQGSGSGSGSSGFFNKAFGGWKRSPQDANADTPGGAQGRPWGKRRADTLSQANNVLSQAGQQLSGTVTKTKAAATGAAATGATGNGAPAGSVGYAGNNPTGSLAAAAATPKASSGSSGSAARNGAPAGTVGYAGSSPSDSSNSGSGSGSGSTSGKTNDMVPDLGSKLGSAPAAAGNMAGGDMTGAGPGGMAGGDMTGSGGWGNWMKKFAGGMAGFR